MIRNYNSLLRSSPTSTLVFADVAEQIVFKETVWGLRAGSSFGSVSCQKSCCHTSTCRLTVEERSESAGYSTSLLPKTEKKKKSTWLCTNGQRIQMAKPSIARAHISEMSMCGMHVFSLLSNNTLCIQ